MVKVEIVEDKDAGASPYASSDSSRTSSSVSLSSVESDISVDETFFDRVAALVDIVPPTTRHSISSRISKTTSFIKRGGKIAGNIVWIVTTSALLVALPLALSLEDEAKIVAQEKEMLEQQQGAQQMLAPSMYPSPPAQIPNNQKALYRQVLTHAAITATHPSFILSLLHYFRYLT
ncbi:mitochondrial import receptor subunit Tom22-domain-containing protein [Infundibulicybe gibba]|nr:mitochondrial import receptor subunit Tom22-domain-containing protein [Infundibulicybe gibba]